MNDLYRIDAKAYILGLVSNLEVLDALGVLVPVEGVEQWYKDHCYAPDDCVVTAYNGDSISVDLSELFGLLGIGTDDE